MIRSRGRSFENQFLERIRYETALTTNTSYLSTSTGYPTSFSSAPESIGFSVTTVDYDHNRSNHFHDSQASSSLCLSLRSLGIDSTSYESIRNMHSNSYLMSRQNEINNEPENVKKPQQPANKKDEEQSSKPIKVSADEKKTRFLSRIFSWKNSPKNWSMDPTSSGYLFWLAIVSICYVYNIFGITVRYTFFEDQKPCVNSSNQTEYSSGNETNINYFSLLNLVLDRGYFWFLFDYLADLVFLIDIFLVQTRMKFLSEGLWVNDFKLTSCHYFKSKWFILDVVSILPFDLVQLAIGTYSFTRLNRLLKLNSLMEFFNRWDRSVQSYIFLVRLFRLFVYLQIVIHIYSCVYYRLSLWETETNLVSNTWVYSVHYSHIQQYVFSFLFGLKTASTIGNNPQPSTKEEYLFTAIAYVLALFLFALIVGQIRNIIGSLSTKQNAYLIVVDTTNRYLKNLDLPENLLNRVKLWFDFYSKEQDAVPFEAIEFLPKSVQTDLAISVYLEIISKVKLFQECEKNLLYALVLKLKPVIYMPGDFICKKGEVGREMFIVDKGVIEVIVNEKAVAQMKVGSCFGEISLLSAGDGGNRRTANVVSKGFSKLLILHKTDFNMTLSDYPDMAKVLRTAADSYLNKKK